MRELVFVLLVVAGSLFLLMNNAAAAEVTAAPFGLSAAVDRGDVVRTNLTLRNSADRVKSFEITMQEVEEEGFLAGANHRGNGGDRPGPQRDRRGEEDQAGYFWVDNAEEDGPDYQWVDIANRQGAVRLNVADEFLSDPLELGFEFPWYGEWYPSLRVCSNGWVSFDIQQDIAPVNNHPQFPNQQQPNCTIAANFWNIAVVNNSSMWFWTNREGTAVISWLNMSCPIAPVRPDITFQVILQAETGMVLLQYGNQLGLVAAQNNVGYEDAEGRIGANILFHEAGVANGLAIAISGPFSKWLEIEPREGTIEAEAAAELDVSFVPEDLEAGVYEMLVTIATEDLNDMDGAQHPESIEISAVMTVADPVTAITGEVSSALNGDVIEGAVLSLDAYRFARPTDEDGRYTLPDLPRGAYEVTCRATDFLPMTRQVEADGDLERLDFSLLHSRCVLDPDRIVTQLAPDASDEFIINLDNPGNGPLTFTVDRRLLGDANADPWTLRASHAAALQLEDNYIMGVAYGEDHFFVAGQNDRQPLIYVLDRDGNLESSYRQPGEDVRGMNDLAWDGSLLWGISGTVVYGFTTEGEVQSSFNAPFALCKNIAWDPLLECLWISSTTTAIARMSPEGENLGSIRAVFAGEQLRVYGLGCYPDDPTGHTIYLYCKERDTNRTMVIRANPDGDLQFVAYLAHEEGGDPLGICITNQFDIYSWVLIAVANNAPDLGGDRVDVWQIDARKDWMRIDPEMGAVAAGENQDLTLTLDATGLPAAEFHGELVFSHDGVGSETHLSITLNVVLGPVQAERTLNLIRGWNMVSVNLQPEPADDILTLTQALVQDNNLLLMKDGFGNFYNPEFEFCNIPGWDVAQGYMLKTDHDGSLLLSGLTVMADDPIDLIDGWQMIAYYPRLPVDAVVAFAGIVDQLEIAKDGAGHFYNPEWEFSNMGNLVEGQGYQVKMDGEAELVYRHQEEGLDNYELRITNYESRLPQHVNTGSNMSLLALADAEDGSEIGVYAGEALVGSGVVTDRRCGIAVWGDDLTTPEVDGATAGQCLRLLVDDVDRVDGVDVLQGQMVYSTDAFTAVRLNAEAVPVEFGIISAYPNPFNSKTQLRFGLDAASDVEVGLYDVSGRLIQRVFAGSLTAGVHTALIDGSSLSSGVYIATLKAGDRISRVKVTMIK